MISHPDPQVGTETSTTPESTYRDDGLVVVATGVIGKTIVILWISHGLATAREQKLRRVGVREGVETAQAGTRFRNKRSKIWLRSQQLHLHFARRSRL